DQRAAASRPRAGGTDHRGRPDQAAVSDDSGDLVAAGLDIQHLTVHADLRTVGAGGERVALDDALGGCVAVAGRECAGEDVVPLEQGAQLTYFAGRKHPRIKSV